MYDAFVDKCLVEINGISCSCVTITCERHMKSAGLEISFGSHVDIKGKLGISANISGSQNVLGTLVFGYKIKPFEKILYRFSLGY